jgi:hypothetical protein
MFWIGLTIGLIAGASFGAVLMGIMAGGRELPRQ